MELSEKEAHCVARLLQGAIYGERNVLNGCLFCKYCCDNSDNNEPVPHYDEILKKFSKETGVDLSPCMSRDIYHSDFPYKKFLKNSNETVKEQFRNFFKDV